MTQSDLNLLATPEFAPIAATSPRDRPRRLPFWLLAMVGIWGWSAVGGWGWSERFQPKENPRLARCRMLWSRGST